MNVHLQIAMFLFIAHSNLYRMRNHYLRDKSFWLDFRPFLIPSSLTLDCSSVLSGTFFCLMNAACTLATCVQVN